MTNLLTLLKVYFRESFDKRKFKQDKHQQTFIAYLIIMGILFITLSTGYSYFYAESYVLAGMKNQIYTLTVVFFIVSSIMVFSSSISKISSVFLGKDYDILSAMPIKKRDIVLAKIFNLYITELIVCLILLIPNSIVSAAFTGNIRYLVVIPLSFIAPAYPMLLALFITAIIELIVKNPKVKNLISTVLMLTFSVSIIAASMIMGFTTSTDDGGLANMFSTLSSSSKFINPTLIFVINGFEKRFLWFFLFVISNFFLLVVVLGIIILAYNKIHNNMTITNINSEKRKFKIVRYNQKSPVKVILGATFIQFMKSKNAVIQCFLGVIISIIASTSIAVYFSQLKTNLNGEEVLLVDQFKDYIFIGFVAITFFLGMQPPSAYLVSLEGKNLFVLKTYPISFKDYLKAKLIFSLIFMGIGTILTTGIVLIFIRQSIFSLIISIIFPFAYMFFIAVFTLTINASFPYLHWKDDIEVFKNHKSNIITTFSDMGICIVSFLIALLLSLFNTIVAGVFLVVVFIALDIVFFYILMNKVPNRLESIEM